MIWPIAISYSHSFVYIFFFYFIFLSGTAYAGPSVSGCTGTETDKQIGMWERRIKGLRRMLLGWDQTKPPDPPNFVAIDVTSINSANLRIQESGDGPISTKFKGKKNTHTHFNKKSLFKSEQHILYPIHPRWKSIFFGGERENNKHYTTHEWR